MNDILLHPSTAGALEALEWLQDRALFANVLDIGCGNGVLAIMAAHLWDCKVLAVDVSANAVADTKENLARLPQKLDVIVLQSPGFKHHLVRETAPYDLIMGNLLAEWQVEMALDIKNHLAPGGYAILAGMLSWLTAPVREAFEAINFVVIHELNESPWHCYILRHNPTPAVTQA